MKKKKEFDYYAEFAESANLAWDAAKELKSYVANFNKDTSSEEKKKIHDIENKADNNLHELKTFLLKDFLPPIDREDIIAIAHRIDDLVDAIDEVVIDIDIYVVNEISEDMKVAVDILEKAVAMTYDLVVKMNNLKNIKEIKEKVIEVNKFEDEGDKLYENATRKLFETEQNPVQVIKWSNIYNGLENCFDACENIADCVEEVLLKNG